MRTALALLLAALSTGAWAQEPTNNDPFASPPPAPSTGPVLGLGAPVPLEKGPWVLGEVLFFSGNKLTGDSAWYARIRARRGILYTRSDALSDVEALKSLDRFVSVDPQLYEIPGSVAPPEYYSIASSTQQVRLVFNVLEKYTTGAYRPEPASGLPPAAVSGVVLTPTAWRGAGRHTNPGLGLDVNAAYFIGRLYGKNGFQNSVRKTNYIDRIGVWYLTLDGKMQVQSETRIRPAIAFGALGGLQFKDAPQPSINTTNNISVPVSQKKTSYLTGGYAVASKKFWFLRTSAGVIQGSYGNMVANYSEFLSPEGLQFYAGQRGQRTRSETVLFASLLTFPKKDQPLAVEFMKFNGAPLHPWMLNFKIGYFAKMNFDVAFLKFRGGYDVLGTIQFRYNHFPRR